MGVVTRFYLPGRSPATTVWPRYLAAATLAAIIWAVGFPFVGAGVAVNAQDEVVDESSSPQNFADNVDRILLDMRMRRSERLNTFREQITVLEKVLQQRAPVNNRQSNPPGDAAAATDPPLPAAPAKSDDVAKPAEQGTPAQGPPVSSPRPPVDRDPVDALALADSLFGAGEVELALQTYSELRPEHYTAPDRRWIRYQIATCQRRLGDTGSAEQLYRELLAANKDDSVAARARWWLESIQTRKRMEGALHGIEAALQTLQEKMP